MRKIQLSRQAEEHHEQYYNNHIKPNLVKESNAPTYIPSPDELRELKEVMKKQWTTAVYQRKFKRQHRLFLRYAINRYKTFALGRQRDLERLNHFIKQNFSLVYCLTRLETSHDTESTYSQHLNQMFGYKQFKVKDFFYYIKKKAIDNLDENQYSPRVQAEIVNILVTNYPGQRDEINACLGQGKLSAVLCEKKFKELTKLNITMDNFKQIDIFLKEWNDYHFVMESGIRVCPYCNRQYITPILSDNGKMRADIDHFLPKCHYPYFSMSLYNLVPVCKSCNQSLKGGRKFSFNSLSPYEDHIGSHFKFEADELTYEITTSVPKGQNSVNQHLSIFKIEALYNYHRNQFEELVKKRIAYPDEYIRDLYEKNKDYFNSELEVKQIIVGFIDDESRLNDEAFLKFRRDLAEQLGFLGASTGSRIDELKKIIEDRKNTVFTGVAASGKN